MTLGAAVGLVAGYSAARWTPSLMRLVDGALAIPRLFLLLLVLAVWERVPLAALILLIGATGWFGTSRLVRGGGRSACGRRRYVRAAEALGATPAADYLPASARRTPPVRCSSPPRSASAT